MARAGASSGATVFERDLTELAREGRLPAAHCIDEDVSALQALIARGAQHVLLSGEPGVGKTARLHELARRIALGPQGEPAAGARLLELSLRAFLSRAGKEEEVGNSWNALVERLAVLPGVTIVALREASLGLSPLLFGSLSDSLRSSSLRFVLETYPSGAQGFLDVEGGLGDLLHLVTVLEPSPERARAILGQVAADLEAQLGMVIDPAACDLTLRLAKKYLLAQHEPARSVELLRGAVEAARAGKAESLGTEEVLTRFCAVSQLPRFLVDDAIPLDLVETEAYFNERILGQPEAVKAVLRTLALLKAGLTDPRRPLGLFLCAGPTGVGKTHLARLLAEYVFGSAERLVRVNMADYAEEDDDSQLFGATWQPVREHRRGQLTRLLEGKLFAVLLLDEFEKAHRSVHDRCLQLFDEGQFINAAGELVRCNNVLIIVTTNAGAEVYREGPLGFATSSSETELAAEADRRLANTFRHELLNRFDAICHFRPLGKVEIRRIAQREVGRVLEREGIRIRGLDVEVAPEVIDLLVERGFSAQFGARFLQREIERTLTAPVAVEIVRRPLPPARASGWRRAEGRWWFAPSPMWSARLAPRSRRRGWGRLSDGAGSIAGACSRRLTAWWSARAGWRSRSVDRPWSSGAPSCSPTPRPPTSGMTRSVRGNSCVPSRASTASSWAWTDWRRAASRRGGWWARRRERGGWPRRRGRWSTSPATSSSPRRGSPPGGAPPTR